MPKKPNQLEQLRKLLLAHIELSHEGSILAYATEHKLDYQKFYRWITGRCVPRDAFITAVISLLFDTDNKQKAISILSQPAK